MSDTDPNRTVADRGAQPALAPVGGRYQFTRLIASGGMGAVHAARDLVLAREVAVKTLLPGADPARFLAESRITAQLPHPNIPPVYDLGELADGAPFLAMKLVAGGTFADLLAARPDPAADLPRMVDIFEQVCHAVGFAHARGVIHRDLKPNNVMVGQFGEVQVMDWGLAKELRPTGGAPPLAPLTPPVGPNGETPRAEGGPHSTRPGVGMGTPAFMPPEQAKGEWDRVDARSDVFALGGILCAVLTGSPPYSGTSGREVFRRAEAADLAPARAALGACGADAELVALAVRCLDPDPAARPADGRAVAEAVGAYRAGVAERLRRAEAERAAAEAKAIEGRKRRRVQALLAAAVLAIAAGAAAYLWREDRRAERERFDAERRADAERGRRERNRDALAAFVGRCETLLADGDADGAADALAEIDRRTPDGGGEEFAARVERCRADLDTLRAFDRLDGFWWTPIQGKLHGEATLAATADAFRRLGIVPGETAPDEAARRVRASLLADRLLTVLDRWAGFGRVAALLPVLRALDPDDYRDAVRAALVAEDEARMRDLIRRPEVFAQPPRFAAVVAMIRLISPGDRLMILESTLRRNARDVNALVAAAVLYPVNRRDGATERVAWCHAALAVRPRHPMIHHILGTALADLGQNSRAVEALAEAVRLDPTNGSVHSNYGAALWRNGEREAGLRHLRRAIELSPNEALAHQNLGAALLAGGDAAGALAPVREAVRLDPSMAVGHATLGRILAAGGKLDDAAASFRAAAAADPEFGVAHRELGITLAAKNDYDGALAAFRAALKLDPFDAAAHVGVGAALGSKDDLDGALAAFRAALKLNPRIGLAWRGIGTALRRKGDAPGALAAVREAANVEPNDGPTRYDLGVLLLLSNKPDEAIPHLREAARLAPALAGPVHIEVGRGLAAKKDFRAAAAEFAAAVRFDPKSAELRGYVALAWAQAGDYPKAEEAYAELVRLAPKNPHAHNDMGYVRELRGDLDGAVEAYRAALALDPKLPAAVFNMARAQRALDRRAPPPREVKRP